eukprot:m.791124 g.791124  ORF g.791124 m.791124 type:complete len:168 (-) comp23330_c1_seq6:4592-5095(-)
MSFVYVALVLLGIACSADTDADDSKDDSEIHSLPRESGYDAHDLLSSTDVSRVPRMTVSPLCETTSLFSHGEWRHTKWMPESCGLLQYFHSLDSRINECLQDAVVIFLGDSRVRGLYHEFVGLLDDSYNSSMHTERHADMVSHQIHWIATQLLRIGLCHNQTGNILK